MIIKLLKVKDVKRNNYNFKEIVGQKADGSEYTKSILNVKGTADLINALDDFGQGDFIELGYDSSQYKNVNSIKAATGFPEKQGNSGAKYAGGNNNTNNYRKSDGTSRGDDTNRSAAIYLAERLIAMKHGDAVQQMTDNDFLNTVMSYANSIYNYISLGKTVEADTNEDPLDPPEVD